MEQGRREKNEIEINLRDVFQILLSKWIIILIAGVVAALAIGLVTRFAIKKKYTASVSMYISTSTQQSQTGTVTNAELVAADNLIKTYQVIVKSNTVLEAVMEGFNADHPEYANRNITVATLSSAASVSVPNGTKLIQIDVKTTDPQLSADIANAFAASVPQEIVRITKAGDVQIVDKAEPPEAPSSPNLKRNVIIGFLAGAVLAAIFFVMKAYLDTTIYTAEEVQKVSRCPVIGTVPMIDTGSNEITPWEVSLKEEIVNE